MLDKSKKIIQKVNLY